MVSENPGGPARSHEEKCPEANRKCRTTGVPNYRPSAPRSCILAATARKINTSLHACAAKDAVVVWGCSSPLLTSAGADLVPRGTPAARPCGKRVLPGRGLMLPSAWRRQLNCAVHFRLPQTPALFLPGFLTSLILNMVTYALCLCI